MGKTCAKCYHFVNACSQKFLTEREIFNVNFLDKRMM